MSDVVEQVIQRHPEVKNEGIPESCFHGRAPDQRKTFGALKRRFPLILRVDGAVAGRFKGTVVVQHEGGA
jgi:hypothetical protein